MSEKVVFARIYVQTQEDIFYEEIMKANFLHEKKVSENTKKLIFQANLHRN